MPTERDTSVAEGIRVVPTASLDRGNFSAELEGHAFGHPGLSLILVEAAPGRGPALHAHDYTEVIIVLEGTATFTDGTTELDVAAGNVVIIAPNQPHGFTNNGEAPLKQIDIHVADAFASPLARRAGVAAQAPSLPGVRRSVREPRRPPSTFPAIASRQGGSAVACCSSAPRTSSRRRRTR